MRKNFFFVLMALCLASDAQAQTASCATIRDHDSRMVCYALVTGNTSWCSFIKDADQRVKCRILLKK